MEKIKEPSVAGTFYPEDKNELTKQIENFKLESKNYYTNGTRAVIVPHAGLVFSGRLAFEGINQLDKNIENIFIFAPSHHSMFEGLALSSYDKWNTPLGEVKINTGICEELVKNFNLQYKDEAFTDEHSVEIQLPIIQNIFENINIIPILVCRTNPEDIEKIIEKYYKNNKNGFIISSDLSHFLTDENAKKIDNLTAQMIETGNIDQFRYEQACGALGIAGLVKFANKNNYSLIRIDMTNSAEITSDKSRVVGYGSWFLYEGTKQNFIEKYCSENILKISRKILETSFTQEQITINYPQVLDENGACFVTLEKNGHLRGCIGSIIAHRPLIMDIAEHTKNAAFKDPRFNPVCQEEITDIKISVSILSEPKQMSFNSEEDLLNKIIPNKDGIIIKDKQYQAVYLPSVWEQIPDKKEFLNSLKMKAGLSADHFSETFEAYRFETIYIKEV